MRVPPFLSRPEVLLLGIFLVLALGSWWLRQDVEESAERHPNPPHTPDYWVERLAARTMDAQGRPRRLVKADTMRHFPDDDSTELTRPQIDFLGPGQPPWQIRAQTGWVAPDGELVLLQGPVTIDRQAAANVRPVHLETRDLRVQPKEEYAETEHAVRVVSGPDRVRSQGLQAWLKEPVRIKLLADVHGHYEVSP
jgi:lipopolysaccharide export system protein LptC